MSHEVLSVALGWFLTLFYGVWIPVWLVFYFRFAIDTTLVPARNAREVGLILLNTCILYGAVFGGVSAMLKPEDAGADRRVFSIAYTPTPISDYVLMVVVPILALVLAFLLCAGGYLYMTGQIPHRRR